MRDAEDWEQIVERALEKVKVDPRLEAADLFKTEAEVFDLRTMKTLSKLISDRYIDTLDFCVSTGKEANVFRGTTPEETEVAVKIYRTNTRTFRSHMEYLWGDPRFQPMGKSNRQVIDLWASKEVKNLYRFLEADCRVPRPITQHHNVVIMEYIGEGTAIAPQLRQVDLDDPHPVFNELVQFVRRAWQEANLVHGDLSEYNILMTPEETIVIDCAQAVVRDHPRSIELLERDVANLCKHFGRLGVDADPETTLATIRGESPPEETQG